MEIEKAKNLENQKKKSDYKVSKELMETLENFGEESIDREEGKKYPNRFAYDLIENGDRDIILNHPENFNMTGKLTERLIAVVYKEDKLRIHEVLYASRGLGKKLALELISSKYLCGGYVLSNLRSFKGLDYEVAKRLALKGEFHVSSGCSELDSEVISYWKKHFVGINDNQWQELLKLSKKRYDSNEEFRRDEIEERIYNKDESKRARRN